VWGQGGCLGGKGVRRGEGVFELAAKVSALHWMDQSQRWRGSDATPFIGAFRENLRKFAVTFSGWWLSSRMKFLSPRWSFPRRRESIPL
jgi:hypothetical protein